MFNPCFEHCYLRYNKQYTKECDNTCAYAKAVLESKNKDKIIDVKLETFESNFRKIVIKAGIDGCTFKNIRNTAITNYFDAGASVGEVMSISGHKKPDTTLRIYRQNTIQQSRNAYSKLLEKQNNILQISYG